MIRYLPLYLVLATAGCVSLGEPVEEDLVLEVPEGLRSVLAAQVSQQTSRSSAVTVSRQAEIDHKGNFGTLIYSSVEESMVVRPDGLLQSTVTETTKHPTAIGQGSSTVASLCGLVPVLSSSGGSSSSRGTTAVPAGKGFVPLQFDTSSEGGMRIRLTRFQANTSKVCDPQPGTSFVVTTQSQRQFKNRSGMFSVNRLATVDDEITCSIRPGVTPASTLHPALSGDYLTALCRHKGTQRGGRESTYAFVRSLGSYVLISEVHKWQSTAIRITAVR